ncbi:MAG: T9SS type A sorting domain-containing protein [Bacteroidales bacterium]|nr:T9SS type A sorting domain-containing protein [Bacteroidales bacterium]
MEKLIISMLVLLAWTTSLSAQITREQADAIVINHIENEVTPPYLLYVNVNAPSEAGIAITTFQEETFKAKYPCWAYYLNENPTSIEPAQHRYLFVKESDGNLLEVITSNDRAPNDLTQWEEVMPVGIVETQGIASVRVYPNPTRGELQVTSYELQVTGIDIYDIMGKKLLTSPLSLTSPETTLNIAHLPNGVYFIKIQTETGTITQKIIKN